MPDYKRTTWVNGTTPLNQGNMNNIETGIEELQEQINQKLNATEYASNMPTISENFVSGTLYKVGSIVKYPVQGEDRTYVCKENIPREFSTIIPPFSTYWMEISASGTEYSLPIANSTTLGGVKPVNKTNAMTQSVGVDSSGALWTEGVSTAKTRLVTIAANQWSSQQYSITISGLQDSDIVLIDGDDSIFDVYGVSASQSGSTITFTCTTLPQVSIQVRLAVIKATSV